MAAGGVLALDLAMLSGWCYGIPGQSRPSSGVWQLAKPLTAGYGRTYASLSNQLKDAFATFEPGLVVAEAPLRMIDNSAELLTGLWVVVQLMCDHWEIECRKVASSTARKVVLGRGNMKSAEAKAAAKAHSTAQGWGYADDNEADAQVVWACACKSMQTPAMRRLVARLAAAA